MKVSLVVLAIFSVFVSETICGRSPYAPYPDDLVAQIIPAGPLWPASQQGYLEASTTTQKPVQLANYVLTFEPAPKPVVAVSTSRPDFHQDPWASASSSEWYGLGSVQELPFQI